jgi:hypothetical protein
VLDPSKRFITIVLTLGVAVLVFAIALGERAGDKVIGQVTEKRLDSIAPVSVTPAPRQTTGGPYGPDWKRTTVMSAAEDPQFPDPRVPPLPPPTPPPVKVVKLKPVTLIPTPSPTPNLNIPIWRRMAPLPTASPLGTPTPSPVPGPSLQPNGEPVGEPSSRP